MLDSMLLSFIPFSSTLSISDYLLNTNVQLGASYPVSQQSTRLYEAGKDAAAKYINASSREVGTLWPKSILLLPRASVDMPI